LLLAPYLWTLEWGFPQSLSGGLLVENRRLIAKSYLSVLEQIANESAYQWKRWNNVVKKIRTQQLELAIQKFVPFFLHWSNKSRFLISKKKIRGR
jgi:hypothetical protein